MNLNEGMRGSDLRGMVHNTVSVDEYQSKIDERAIVIAFCVVDKDAAQDLNRFIQKSHVDILDTEVSAAPDQKGNYLVFVEMALNDKTAKAVSELCADVNSLADLASWIVKVRGSEPSKPVAADAIADFVREALHLSLEEFFSNSDLETITLSEGLWHAASPASELFFSVTDFGSFEHVVRRNKLNEQAVSFEPEALRVSKHIRSLLGAAWAAEVIGEHVAIYNSTTDALVLLSHRYL